MASELEALILSHAGPLGVEGVPLVPLADGLALVPITDEVVELVAGRHSGRDNAMTHNAPDIGELRGTVASWAVELSSDRKVLYVYAETWAGAGFQNAIGWDRGAVFFGPALTCDDIDETIDGTAMWYSVVPPKDSAVNRGLRAIGLRKGGEVDEFAAAGLMRHRFTGDWLEA